jgi:hypothetical protein
MQSHSQRGGLVAGLLLTLGILALLALVGVVIGGLYVAHHIHVSKSDVARGETVNVDTPFGSMRFRHDAKVDPKRLGVPVYPGAVLNQDRHKLASFEFDFGSDHSKEVSVVAGEYTTSDSLEKVRDFYRAELPHWMFTENRHGAMQFEFNEGGHKKIVALKERNGVTRIGLASVGEPATN